MKKLTGLFIAVALCMTWHPATARGQSATSICGVVLDQRKNPVAGIEIVARDSAGKVTREGITDARGRYCLADLPPGKYNITENPRKSGFKGDTVVADLPKEGLTVDWSLSVTRAIASTASPGALSCTSFICTGARTTNIAGFVLDPKKNPVSGIQVAARDSTGKVIREAITDAKGRYCLADLRPGEYNIIVNPGKSGFKGDTVITNVQEEGLMVDWNISVPSAIALAAGPGPFSCDMFVAPTINIAGIILDQDKNPVSGVEIIARDSAGKVLREGITDERGRYCLADLQPGKYNITENPGNTGFKSDTVVADVRQEGLSADWNISVPSAVSSIVSPGPSSCTPFLCEGYLPPGAWYTKPAMLGLGALIPAIVCGSGSCSGGGGGGVVTPSQ